MKKFEEAELSVIMLENCIICTSGGCTGAKSHGCSTVYDSNSDSYYTPNGE